MDNTTGLWEIWANSPEPGIIVLENIEHKVIGSLDLKKYYGFKEAPIISTTNNSEKYYLYFPELGLGLYFSYYKRLKEY